MTQQETNHPKARNIALGIAAAFAGCLVLGPQLLTDPHTPFLAGVGNLPTEWVNQLPKPGEPTQKEVDGKVWYVCEHHKRWCLHRTEDCKKKGLDHHKEPGKKRAENKRVLRATKATVRWSDIEHDDESSQE